MWLPLLLALPVPMSKLWGTPKCPTAPAAMPSAAMEEDVAPRPSPPARPGYPPA